MTVFASTSRRSIAAALRAAFDEAKIRSFYYPSQYIPVGALVIVAGEPAEWDGNCEYPRTDFWEVNFLLARESQPLSKGAFTMVQRVHPADQPMARYIIEGLGRDKADKAAFVARYTKPTIPIGGLVGWDSRNLTVGELIPGDRLLSFHRLESEYLPADLLGFEETEDETVTLRFLTIGDTRRHGKIKLTWNDQVAIYRPIPA